MDESTPEQIPSRNLDNATAPPQNLIQRIPSIPFAALALGVIFILYQVVGGVMTWVVIAGDVTAENVTTVRWMTLFAQIFFILLPTVMLVRWRYPGQANWFRIHPPDLRHVALSLIAVFALQQVLQGYLLLQDMIPLPQMLEDLVKTFRSLMEQTYKLLVSAQSPVEFLFVVLVIAVTPAIAEELFFRGLVQRSFEQATVGVRGAIIAGIIFAAYHINPFTFLPLAALGVFFGFIVYRSGNLTIGIIAHFFNNFVACLAVYLQLNDDFVAVAPTGEPSSMVRLLNYLAFGVVFVVSTYYFVRVTRPAPETAERGG